MLRMQDETHTGHKDLILMLFVGMGEDIGALKRLWEEAKDVIDDEDSTFG